MNTEQRITKAKVSLLVSEPWFGQLSCYLNVEERKEVETACITERGDMFYNNDFVTKLNDRELRGLICHEIMHLAFQHPFRVGARDLRIWNIACDIKVNYELRDHRDYALPANGIIPRYDGTVELGKGKGGKQVVITNINEKTTEQIYEELNKQAIQIPVSYLFDLTKAKQLEEQIGPKEMERLRREWQARIASSCTMKGNVPEGLLRELKELENPELPWSSIIRQRFKSMIWSKSWKKPNKRWLPFYFPGHSKTPSLKAAVAIDTSGSISHSQLKKAMTELWGLANAFKSITIHIYTCDADVWDSYVLTEKTKNELLKIKVRGGGGTDFRPVFKKIHKDLYDNVDCLMFFTDGYGDFPDKAPRYQTFWITDSYNIKWPFGREIRMKSYDND